jgi:hypothetical protein
LGMVSASVPSQSKIKAWKGSGGAMRVRSIVTYLWIGRICGLAEND